VGPGEGGRVEQIHSWVRQHELFVNAESNPICYLLALLGAHHIFHVSRIRVKIVAD
jgi:hypothetical protein